jgi:uncharacterized membrane protein YdjX (TVP38/TMEM64 family)
VDARHWPKLALLAAIVLAAALFFGSGAHTRLDAEAMRVQVLASGAWGPLLFGLAFALLHPLGASGHLFVIAASVIWPPLQAFGLSLVAICAGQVLAFFVYRYLAHDWAQARIPVRLRRFERQLFERPVRSVFVFRLLAFTWPLAPLVLGASRVKFGPMFLATVLGMSPPIALDVWLGAEVIRSLWRC